MADPDFDSPDVGDDGDFNDSGSGYEETFSGEVGNGGNFGGDDGFAADFDDFGEVGTAQNDGFASNDGGAVQQDPEFIDGTPTPVAAAPPVSNGGGEPEAKGAEETDSRVEWRRQYNARLEAKRAAESEAIRSRKEAAAQAISEYYEQKEKAREAKLSAGRTSEQTVFARLDEVASGNTWDRVLSLIDIKEDINLNVADVSRFKNVLVRLKNEPVDATADGDA